MKVVKKYIDSFRDKNGSIRNGMILTHIYLIYNCVTFTTFVLNFFDGGVEQGVIYFGAAKAFFHAIFVIYSICSIAMRKYLVVSVSSILFKIKVYMKNRIFSSHAKNMTNNWEGKWEVWRLGLTSLLFFSVYVFYGVYAMFLADCVKKFLGMLHVIFSIVYRRYL